MLQTRVSFRMLVRLALNLWLKTLVSISPAHCSQGYQRGISEMSLTGGSSKVQGDGDTGPLDGLSLQELSTSLHSSIEWWMRS